MHGPGAENQVTTAPPRRLVRKLLRAVCLLVVACLALLGLAAGVFQWWAIAERDAELAKVRAAGEPINADELDAYYARPPADRDATELWLAAAETLMSGKYEEQVTAWGQRAVPQGEHLIPHPEEPWDEWDSLQEIVDAQQEVLDKLYEATELGGAARFPVDFHRMLDEDHEGQALRNSTRLLQRSIHLAVRRGDHATAARGILTLLALGKSKEAKPTLIAFLECAAFNQHAMTALGDSLCQVEFNDRELERFAQALAAIDYATAMPRALVGERAYWHSAYTNGFTDPPADDRRLNSLGWLSTASEAAYLRQMQLAIDAARTPFPQAFEALQPYFQDCQRTWEHPSMLNRAIYLMNGLISPAITAYFNVAGRSIAEQRAGLVAIALERYRRQHGQMPERLEQLVPDFLPELPIDPFSGAPLLYRVEPQRVRIYSAGPNQQDDGGDNAMFQPIPPPEKPVTGDDWTVDVRLPAVRPPQTP